MHYNWEPKPYYQPDEVLEVFRKNRVTGILATSRPNTGTHVLMDGKASGKAGDLQVVPFIRPYRVRADIGSWFNDPVIFDLVQEEFKRGYYRGVGEFHLTGKAADTEMVKKTVDFAVANNLYLHAHADDEAVEILMRHNPRAQIIWAHTGFSLAPDRVAAMLVKYPKLWGEVVLPQRHRGRIRQTDAAMARAVRALPRSLPAGLRHLGAGTLGELWRYHGWLSCMAGATAAGGR